MEKFEFEGNIYIYHNNQYYDEHFIALCKNDLLKVMAARAEKINYKLFSESELLDLIKNYKKNELYEIAKKISEYGMEKYYYNDKFIRSVLPIFTSCCRKLNMPNEAIRKSNLYLKASTCSPALNTSLAAAYCDIGDYNNAKKHAGLAYAKLANLPYNEKIEIANVYARIKAEFEK